MASVPAVSTDRLLSREDAAAYLGVAPATLAAWACLGRYGLRYSKIGRLCRYRQSDLDAFVEQRSVEHTGEMQG